MSTAFKLLFFGGLIVIALIYGDVAFVRGAGFYFVINGISMAWKKTVPIGWRGAEPSSYLVGSPAIAFSTLVVCFGGIVFLYARELACFLSKAQCL